ARARAARARPSRVLLTRLEPVHGDAQLGCELSQRLHARRALVLLDPAEVAERDSGALDVALAHAELAPSFPDPIAHRLHAAHRLAPLVSDSNRALGVAAAVRASIWTLSGANGMACRSSPPPSRSPRTASRSRR